MGQHFPKQEKLAHRRDIERLFADGEAFLAYPVKCTWRAGKGGTPEAVSGTSLPERGQTAESPCVAAGNIPFAGTPAPVAEPGTTHAPRLLFLVGKKIHKRAVARNLLRRRMREAYRLSPSRAALSGAWPEGIDIALSYIAKECLPYSTIEAAVDKILRRLIANTQMDRQS